MHPTEELIRRFYAARATRDTRALAKIIDKNAVLRLPGRSLLAGEYRGLSQLLSFFDRRRELTNGRFSVEIHDALIGQQYAAMVGTGTARRGEKSITETGIVLFRTHDERIAECRLYPEDLYAFDEFWS